MGGRGLEGLSYYIYVSLSLVYAWLLQLSQSKCRKGRHWLMWSLLHFVTSTIQSKQPQQVSIVERWS